MSSTYVTIRITKDEADIIKNNVIREIWRNSSELKGVNLSYMYCIRRMRRWFLKNSPNEVDT